MRHSLTLAGRRPSNFVLKITLQALAATALTVAAISPALGHATLENSKAQNNSYHKAVMRIPHGCDGKATNAVHVKLPEGFIDAKPMPKPGWTVEVMEADYEKAYDLHGKEITSGPVEIHWSGGSLPSDFYDEFAMRGRVAGFDKETDIAFPVTQLCGENDKVVWDEIPAAGVDTHSLAHPAPQLTVLVASNDAHSGHGDHKTMTMDKAVTVGDLELTGLWTRAMLPGQKAGGGFLIVSNTGSEDDRLVGFETNVAGKAEVHTMEIVDDVMKMRPLADGIVIPAGETVELKPGGLHLMFMAVTEPFTEGETVPVTLIFEKAGKLDVDLKVMPANTKGGMKGHKHSG